MPRRVADHVAAAKLWGMERAGQMLDGALTTLESAPRQPPGLATSSNGALDTAVSKEMSTVGQRLFDNAYVRSIEALLATPARPGEVVGLASAAVNGLTGEPPVCRNGKYAVDGKCP